MAKRKATENGEEQRAPKRRTAAKLRRDEAVSLPPSQGKTDVATGSHETREKHGNGQDPGQQPVEKLTPSTNDGANEAERRDDHESSVHDRSGQSAARNQAAGSASDKDEHRREYEADPRPDPTSADASDAAPAAVTGGDAGGVGIACPPSPRPSSQQSLSQSKPSETKKRSDKTSAIRGGGEAEEATTTAAHLGINRDGKRAAAVEAETRNDQSERQVSGKRRKVEAPTPSAGPKATPGAGARGQGKRPPPPAPVRRVSPLALPQVPRTIPPTQPGILAEALTKGKASTSAKASPPAKAPSSEKASPTARAPSSAKASPPAKAPSSAKASIPALAPSALTPKSPRPPPCSGPRSRHPPLPSPAARTPIPADRSDDLEPLPWEERYLGALIYDGLKGLAASQFVLMAELNGYHDCLPPLLTREGLRDAPARSRRFRSDVVEVYNTYFQGPLSIKHMNAILEAMSEKLDGLWKAGRQATNEPKWEGRNNGGYAVV